jgi:ribosomal protein S18 acetylase RimI-like enzyme
MTDPAAVTDPQAVVLAVTASGIAVSVGPMRARERAALFDLFEDVVAKGDGFPHSAPLTHEAFESTWVTQPTLTVCATIDGELAGAYYLKPNFVGRAAHIANAGYAVAARLRGRGVGRCLLEDSLRRAPLLGFDAMQFNLVFESNPARRLYEKLGFEVLGRVPSAVDGEDCLIYWRSV